ncbi:17-beta-hydroxysteroid dehydrogenase 13-like [Penaeus japonicus]|uniref:17-beta-hydroxysteroid dehydrogenase 13-like n=1 Tax=Penaeus japonicus TaxID=27405 RepID=UPI001C70F21E|nr:17-beta-hydroxysteroid dehydrogenase 13-like [Penaeus japonicus]
MSGNVAEVSVQRRSSKSLEGTKPIAKEGKSVTWKNGGDKKALRDRILNRLKTLGQLILSVLLEFLRLNGQALYLLGKDVLQLALPPKEKSLRGALVLVTGSGQNLGRELSLQLAQHGARLVLWDFNEDQNEETAKMIRDGGGEAHAFTCDVSDQKAVASVAAKVREEIGHPEYVINNAGTYCYKPFLTHSPEEISRLVSVNLLGNMWVTREFLGHMVDLGRGHVVSVSSILGYMGRNYVVPYCASKFGVKGMTEALAEEIRKSGKGQGICVTAVHPFLISNVSDVKPNLKFPSLFEVLTPTDAARRIIRGIRRNQEELFLPEKLKPLIVMSKVLPRSLRRLFGDYMEY